MNPRQSLALTGRLSMLLLAGAANAQVGFDGNILFRNRNGSTVVADQYSSTAVTHSCLDGIASPATASSIANWFDYNQVVDPDLNASYATPGTDDWRPNGTSPALLSNGSHTVVHVSELDPWFDDVPYAGALSDDASDDWTRCNGGASWVYTDLDGGAARGDLFAGKTIVVVPGGDVAAAGTVFWTNGNVYVLQGRVSVPAGVTLDVQAGTVVAGEVGSDAYLVVERDGFLDAVGSCDQPIIFTSDALPGDQLPGDWGGVVLHGKSTANCGSGGVTEGCGLTASGLDCISEGNAGSFGGSDVADGSANLQYFGIEYAGREISPDNELNALTMNAQGTGSTIQYGYAILGTDDLFEWFGGTVRTKYFVGIAGADDGLDWQMGYTGFHQFGIIHSISLARGGQDGDSGIEADNNEFDTDCPNRSNPCMANLTLIGSPDLSGRGARLRRGTDGSIYNSIIVDWNNVGFQYGESGGLRHGTGIDSQDCLRAQLSPQTTVGLESVYAFRVNVGPNPIVGHSTFSFSLPQRSKVELRVFNAAGRLVDTVFSGTMEGGSQLIGWNPRNVTPGVYYYNVVAGDRTAKGKLLVMN